MYDVVFISYDELNAEENWNHLSEQIPWARRVHGISGIFEAHQEAEKIVETDFFFTVDGDNRVDDDFDWTTVPDLENHRDYIHVWRCRNPVNGLVYGYGGVKLWPNGHLNNFKNISVDITTNVANGKFKVQPHVASTTYFNTSPFNSWRAGFRECAKLSSGIIKNADPTTEDRIQTWINEGEDAEFGKFAMIGALMGSVYGRGFADNLEELRKINDFYWLRKMFDETGL